MLGVTTLRCGASVAVEEDFGVPIGDAGFRLDEARRYCVLFGVPLLEVLRLESDCLVRSIGVECLSLRILATEGDLDMMRGDCARLGDLEIDFRGVVGGRGVGSVLLVMCVTRGDSVGSGCSPSIEGKGLSGSMAKVCSQFCGQVKYGSRRKNSVCYQSVGNIRV